VNLSARSIVFLAGFLSYIAIRGRFARQTKANVKTVRRVDGVEIVLLVLVGVTSLLMPVLYVFTPLLAFADYPLPLPVWWCGFALMAASVVLFYRSHVDLGLNWSASLEMREGHTLVTHGVYRAIRHPMYAAILLFDVAQGLMLQNWLAGWSALAIFILLYAVRAPREERMMLDAFGDEYREYLGRTGRVVPRVGRLTAQE
jgi:protein-S-isoprenylcysteine O-methyltransferase Ste14